MKERIRRFLKYINREEQSTIILTTHDLDDIEELCPRLILIDRGKILYDGSQEEIKDRFGRWRRVILEFKEDYAAQYAGRPLPGPEVPLSFAGLDPLRLERRAAVAREMEEGESAPPKDARPPAQPTNIAVAQGADAAQLRDDSTDAPERVLAGAREPAGEDAVEASGPPANGAANGSGVNSLDEPGARQFMAALAGVLDDGAYLRVRRLNLRQYRVSFDRTQHTAGEVIGRLLERFAVEDLELREPELADIVRAIYEGRHTL